MSDNINSKGGKKITKNRETDRQTEIVTKTVSEGTGMKHDVHGFRLQQIQITSNNNNNNNNKVHLYSAYPND